jgi:hypothetical protein
LEDNNFEFAVLAERFSFMKKTRSGKSTRSQRSFAAAEKRAAASDL